MDSPVPNRKGTYLRHHQREELQQERDRLQSQLTNPQVQEPGAVRRELRRVESTLEHQSPPELTGEQRDVVAREERELRKQIGADMLSGEELRKSPPGAVGRLMAFERKHKDRILRWKNLRIALSPDDPNPDLANLETLRPHSRATDPSMQGAFIEGKAFSFPSERFKENYGATFGHGDRDVEQEDRDVLLARLEEMERRLEELNRAAPAESTPKKRKGRSWTPEQKKQQRERMIALREKKKAEAEAQATA